MGRGATASRPFAEGPWESSPLGYSRLNWDNGRDAVAPLPDAEAVVGKVMGRRLSVGLGGVMA